MNQIGRNDRCPCGSGLKYKRCCLSKHERQSTTTTTLSPSMSVSSSGLLLDANGKVVCGSVDTFVRDSQDRIDAFMRVSSSIPDEQYGDILGRVIHNSPNYKLEKVIPQLFSRPNKSVWMKHLMTRKERKYLASLPDTITIYRGFEKPFFGKPRNMRGWSWSLDEGVARWFASRYCRTGREGIYVHRKGGRYFKGECTKNDVVAFFGRHGEMEIFINPECVRITDTLPVPEDFDYHKVFEKRETTINGPEWWEN